MKIDILLGENTYGTTSHFAQGLKTAWERQEVDVRLFEVGEGHFFHAFYAIMADPPDFTCSFSDISLNREISLGDLWEIPHLSLLVDPPIYFLHHLSGKYGYCSCVDQLDCDFIQDPRTFFLPHGVDPKYQTHPRKERPHEVVFFGTCVDYEEIAASWLKQERDLLYAASERVLSPVGISIAQALLELNVAPIDLPRYHGEVDRYTRGKDRVELIRSLKSHPIHIWGEGPWKKYLPDHSIHPPLSFDQTLEVMKESKIVLNSSPRFKGGAHERIFYAIMCGAAVLTGENSYLSKHLSEIFTYRFGKWEDLSLERWEEKAQEAQQQVLSSHTWDTRAQTILNFMRHYLSSG